MYAVSNDALQGVSVHRDITVGCSHSGHTHQ